MRNPLRIGYFSVLSMELRITLHHFFLLSMPSRERAVAPFLFFLISFILFTVSDAGRAQSTSQLVLREALVIPGAPGLNETITAIDPIEAMLVTGTWRKPGAGERLRYNDTLTAAWETIQADPDGWFTQPLLRNAYLLFRIDLESDRVAMLRGMGHALVYVNGTLRSGNPYGYKETYEPWKPRFDFASVPVELRKGRNEMLFYCNRGRFKVSLEPVRKQYALNLLDTTRPDLVTGDTAGRWASVVVINASAHTARNLVLHWEGDIIASGAALVPPMPPHSVRKVGLRFLPRTVQHPGRRSIHLALRARDGSIADSGSLALDIVRPEAPRKETFVSGIDGSVQYYAWNPSRGKDPDLPQALFVSLHGANVEAINQARSYQSKSWGHILAPTNRRPYGFNWEDWGRLDLLEVLEIVKKKYRYDPSRVYLTGHSMGGHGTWHNGILYPDRFAAIGPSAGWISFWTYRVRERPGTPTPMREMLMRAVLPSETFTLAPNLASCGIYIIHGSADDNVPVEQSRMMVNHLSSFHRDFVYHEQKGENHWWDLSPEPGADCVDWPPLFDFFARHARPYSQQTTRVTFLTPNPGVSSKCFWIEVEVQEQACLLSGIDISYEPGLHRFTGTTRNVHRLSVDLRQLAITDSLTVILDGRTAGTIRSRTLPDRIWCEKRSGSWIFTTTLSPSSKGPHRYGTFKDVFRNRMMFVYGTRGSREENRWALEKARYDAEKFWYLGNASVDVVPDKEFNPHAEPDRNVILYGNARSNSAWGTLLGDSPVQVRPGEIRFGTEIIPGNHLCCLVIRPRPGSNIASVGAVAGTGIRGMRLTNRMAYLSPGIAFPDCLVADTDLLSRGESAVVLAGFFGSDWTIGTGEFIRGKTGWR